MPEATLYSILAFADLNESEHGFHSLPELSGEEAKARTLPR